MPHSFSVHGSTLKRCGVWMLSLIGLFGVVVGYYGIYVLLAYFATGLVGWASLALLVGGPIGAVAACLAWIRPRQPIAMTIGLFAFAAWLLLWILMFTVFGFKLGS